MNLTQKLDVLQEVADLNSDGRYSIIREDGMFGISLGLPTNTRELISGNSIEEAVSNFLDGVESQGSVRLPATWFSQTASPMAI